MSCETTTALFRAVFVAVTMVASVHGNRALEVCGDPTGYKCMYQTNSQEYSDVPVTFDRELPSWLLGGTLIRNGPAMFERGQQSVTHVFDGFAKLSSWRFLPDGTSLFSSRFIRSNCYKDTMDKDHLAPYMLFSEPDPPFKLVQRETSILRGIDNMNINIIDFPKNQGDPEFAVFSDYFSVYHVSGRDLSTEGLIKPKLKGGASLVHVNVQASGHPLPEPGTNNRLTFLVRQRTMKFFKNRLSLVRMSSVSERSLVAEWKFSGDIPYMHSFSVTQTKAIMVTGPIITDIKCMFKKAAPLPCLQWFDDKPSGLYIVDLKSGKKKTIKMKSSLFAIHHINAYDLNDNEIVMDVVSYDSEGIVKGMLLMDTVMDQEKSRKAFVAPIVRRVFINLSEKTADVQDMVTTTILADGLDMPAINKNYRSRAYCYVYGINNYGEGQESASTAIIKKNMCDGGKVVGKLFKPLHYPMEPAFVPNPDGDTEDDGVLLVPFLRGEDAVTYLAVVDAKTMTIISQADTPDYIPFSLHGKYFNDYY